MSDQIRRVYVWEFPVRLTHWVNVLSILTLSVTGFYIYHPFIHAYSADQYIMGWMRFIHFAAAYVFLMSIIIRIYWAFAGNKYANWRVFFPVTPRAWKEFVQTMKYYFLIIGTPSHAVGHQAFAAVSYLVLFLFFIFEIISGFALYSLGHEGGFIWTLLGGWLLSVMNLQHIRLYHHLVMYVIMAFVITHVYLTWHHGSLDKDGIMGSMFSGHKFIDPKELEQ